MSDDPVKSVRPGGPVRLAPAPPDEAPGKFHRGTEYPQAIAWFGFQSFWGHMWKLGASLIATEDIDSRDWMRADDPDELSRRIALELGGKPTAGTITEALDRDIWIDFVADTGDDVSVSRSVAETIFRAYEVGSDDGESLFLPRGDILLFGGDTAYPVANELEIHNRVIVPFNRVLRSISDPQPQRVLLGVPGNHDWYAGLDGFGRMFRAPIGTVDRSSALFGIAVDEGAGEKEEIVSHAPVRHLLEWAEALRVGRRVIKRTALPLAGYRPVQNASYFAIRLAPGLDLWGPDRQLHDIDDRQRAYFARERDSDPTRGLLLCLADPPYAFLERYEPGMRVLDALDVDLSADGPLAMTGDVHHYCRLSIGRGTQVTAGGGGAFLHPARIARTGFPKPEAEFPGPRASLRLALSAPWQVARGRAGLMIHAALLLAFLPAHLASKHGHPSSLGAAVTGTLLAVVLAWIGGITRKRTYAVTFLALGGGTLLGLIPYGLGRLGAFAWRQGIQGWWVDAAALTSSVFAGAFVVGLYFMALTVLGVATDGGFGPLAHPGYKHFVRLRIKRDGSEIEGFAIGKVDPLAKDEPAILIDRFSWKNPRNADRDA
ncbi:MAG: hypothetical protein HOV80_09250 [Polyangiaceae bacterium]|nr:hypothetical protein [Polyangiaceae bacterium]